MIRFAALLTLLIVLTRLTAADPDTPVTTLKCHKGTLSCLAFSRDGQLLASAVDGAVIAWGLTSRPWICT